jgi:hypothetical protein
MTERRWNVLRSVPYVSGVKVKDLGVHRSNCVFLVLTVLTIQLLLGYPIYDHAHTHMFHGIFFRTA